MPTARDDPTLHQPELMLRLKALFRFRYYVVTLAAAIVAIGFFIKSARTPLGKRSEDAVSSMLAGDVSGLMRYATEREKSESGLNNENLEAVLRDLLLPYVDPNRKPTYNSQDSSGEINGVAEVTVWRRDGAQRAITFEIWHTEEGARARVLGQVLLAAWMVRYSRREGGTYPRGEQFRAAIRGLSQDEPTLKKLGLRGLTPEDPNESTRDWNTVLSQWKQELAGDQTRRVRAGFGRGNP